VRTRPRLVTWLSIVASPCLAFAAPNPQTPTTVAAGATTLLTQLAAAFSGGNIVHQVQLTGNATWEVGSLDDSGTATLSAAAAGSSQLQLSLSASGARTELQSGQGTSMSCTWSGADGVAHPIDPGNCWRPMNWFLPALSLQPSLLPTYLGAADLGTGAVGFSDASYRHLQCQLVFPALATGVASYNMQRSTTDLGLDPTSLLPAVLSYSIWPDNGASVPIAIEIHYSNYKAVDGVQIPFTIERYINGSLQLAIAITSAQVS
jgi:hypothetical protein